MAINFSKVKSITIPEGSVSKITISSKIVWQKNDLSSYTVLPYLVAVPSSNAYIDLGIPYQNGCKAEYKITHKGSANIFGVFYTNERCRGYTETSSVIFNVGTSASSTAYTRIDNLVNDTDYIITVQADTATHSSLIKIGDNTDKYNNVPEGWLTWDSSPHNMYLFAVNRTDTSLIARGKRIIHYFKYWDANGNLLLDLIPVERKSDGVLGMFNKVNGQFLTNIADGTFYKELPANTSDYVEDDIDII